MTVRVAIKQPSADVVLRSGHANAEGKMPVRVQVIYDRKAKYYPVNFDGQRLYLTPDEWEELHATKDGKPVKHRGTKRDIQLAYEAAKAKAQEAIRTLAGAGKPFTFERFESEYLQQQSEKGFLQLFRDHLERLKAEGRIGTYKAYKNAFSAFNKFRGGKYDKIGNEVTAGKEVDPIDITPALLKDFETNIKKGGAGRTTVAIYMRALKVIFNLAADRTPTLLESYPFARKQTDRNRYKIRTGAGHKGESLTVEQLQKFVALKTIPGLPDHEAKMLWLFSFYCQGMNMKDIALLKYRDIQGDSIRYVRAKTKDTEAQEAIMEIPLTDPIRKIIAELGNPDKSPGSYVFLIIPNGLASAVKRRTENTKSQDERIDEIIRQKIKMVNVRLKALCKGSKDADLKELELTTYWARHTFASLLKEAGESVEMIRELLGHSDIRTTESYLKRFDKDKRAKVNEKIQSLLKVS